MVTDSIGDLIIQLKNGGTAHKEVVGIPYSKFKFAVATKLEQSGYVKSVSKKGKKTKKCIEVELLYSKDGSHKIQDVARVSKPGKRVYKNVSEIKPVRHGTGLLVLSTPNGILTDTEARKQKVGGEALFKIW